MIARIPGIVFGTLVFAGVFTLFAYAETCQLSASVAAKRQAIVAGAEAKDPDMLGRAADPTGTFFSQGLGEGFAKDMRFHQEKYTRDFSEILLKVLAADCAKLETEEGESYYIWPDAAALPLDALNEKAQKEVADINASTPEKVYISNLDGTTSYVGWRVVITEDGRWRQFISGE